jgi:serine/threonine protein kinase
MPTTATIGEPIEGTSISSRFRLLQKLGQGGMGTVHRAFDSLLGHEVALKAIDPARPDDLYRLKREFRLLADLEHPNLVRLHELFVGPTSAFFTMELLHGSDFCRFIQGPPRETAGIRRKTPPTACDFPLLRKVARQLAFALSAVHAAGKLHRDVKPSNILISSAGRLVLFDFGLATSMCPKSARTKSAGVLLGTRGYVSPEQARGEPLTIAADWYGFGVTLFEAITGRLPFDDGFKAFLSDRDADAHSHIGRYLPDVPEDLDDLIARLLRPSPDRRPTTDEVMAVLEDPGVSGDWPLRNRPRTHPPAAFANIVDAGLERLLEKVKRGNSAILHVRQAGEVSAEQAARTCVEEAEKRGALVLRGRCRASENIELNAIDEVIDGLSHVVEHLPYTELISVLPPHVAALPRLFPVLGRLEAPSGLTFEKVAESDSDARSRARGALRDLLGTLAERRRPIVIWIDDAHLGDRESGELLGELLSSSDRLPILAVLSYGGEHRVAGMSEVLTARTRSVASFDVAAG